MHVRLLLTSQVWMGLRAPRGAVGGLANLECPAPVEIQAPLVNWAGLALSVLLDIQGGKERRVRKGTPTSWTSKHVVVQRAARVV